MIPHFFRNAWGLFDCAFFHSPTTNDWGAFFDFDCYLPTRGDFSLSICQTAMRYVTTGSLVCRNNHCFDISKHGYVHLAARSYPSKYDKQLFEARRAICEQGFFDPLYAVLSRIIEDTTVPRQKQIHVLDAGCGEGSHLSQIGQYVLEARDVDFVGVGIDLSKEGVMLAAKYNPDAVWCVGDLTKAPFADSQFAYILNLLSPSNTNEFHRLLADDGTMIKVIPESQYLQELRDLLYQQTPKQHYANQRTTDHFATSFQLIGQERVQYRFRLDEASLSLLLQMTPLAWNATNEQLERLSQLAEKDITVDLAILIGKKRIS